MKRLILAIALLAAPVAFTACQSAPATRNQTVSTLLAVGHVAETAVSLSATLYADKKITEEQAFAVFEIYNTRFQPAYRVARTAAKFNGAAIAPAELVTIANEMTVLVASYRK